MHPLDVIISSQIRASVFHIEPAKETNVPSHNNKTMKRE